MSLHVDFLHDDERHDPLARVLRTALFSLCILLAVGSAFYVLFAYLGLATAQIEYSRAVRRNAALDENVKTAVSLERDLSVLKAMDMELKAISNSAFKVSGYLDAIAKDVPGEIQLTSLSFRSTLVSDPPKNERYGRRYQGEISGQMKAKSSEGLVVSMIDSMRMNHGQLFGSVAPGGLDVNPEDPSVLLFDICIDFGFRDYGVLKPSIGGKERSAVR